MPKKQKNEQTQKISTTSVEDLKLETEVFSNLQDSIDYLSNIRTTWDDKEAMLMGKPVDEITKKGTKSQVFDPRLSTIVFERSARVMAQSHVGHSYAESKNDVGKNKLMDLMLGYYTKCANEQFPMLMKLRMLDFYSLVYGSFFALVPWRINKQRGHVGPEMVLIPMRDVHVQPNTIFGEADWVTIKSMVSMEWLKQQDPKIWKNIDEVERDLKESGGDYRESDEEESSFVERTFTPDNQKGSKSFPQVELYTEYRRDKWITFVKRDPKKKGSQTRILRVVENPYPGYKLPVVKKDAFPLIDRVIGLGEFERGETLQRSINSLINLYLDGVKYSIFPPLQINPNADNLIMSSLQWEAGAKWFVGRPNQDVQTTQLSPLGINTFNSTYGFLVGALQNQSGTTSTNEGDNVQSTLGKTPQAINALQQRENARDEWDRFMMESAIKEVYERWIDLTVENLDAPVAMRLYDDEIKDITQMYPDAAEMFESGTAGRVKVKKDMIKAKYDYKVEVGSTMKKDPQAESGAVKEMLGMIQQLRNPQTGVIENPKIVNPNGEVKEVVVSELIQRAFATSGIQDWDKIFVDSQAQDPGMAGPMPAAGVEGTMPGAPQPGMEQPPQGPPPVQVDPREFNDAEIQQVAAQMFGGGQ